MMNTNANYNISMALVGVNRKDRFILECGSCHTLGVSKRNDFVIDQPKEHHTVSRRHAIIFFNPEDNEIYIQDVSLNGTYVGWDKEHPEEFKRLPFDTPISIGLGMYVMFCHEMYQLDAVIVTEDTENRRLAMA